MICFVGAVSISDNEIDGLKKVAANIEKYNESCVCGRIVTCVEDNKDYDVNYYIDGGDLKKFSNSPD